MLEKTLESPLDCKKIQPVNPKGNQTWIFIGKTDAEAETPILWPPDMESRLIRKDLGDGKDWRQEEKGMTEDKVVGWHHQFNGHKFEQTQGDGEGQGSLAVLQSMGSQRVRHNWVTEQQQQITQACLILCDRVDCSPPGSSVHGISQARILEWGAIFFFRGSSSPRIWIRISRTGRQILYRWTTQVAPKETLVKEYT